MDDVCLFGRRGETTGLLAIGEPERCRSPRHEEQGVGPRETDSNLPDVAGFLISPDNVLYDATEWRRWLLQVLARLGLRTHFRAFFRVWDRDYLPAVHNGQCDYWRAFRDFLKAAGLSWSQIDEVEFAARARLARFDDGRRALCGARRAVHTLAAKNYTLAVVTNSTCCGERLDARLDRLGLGQPLACALSSRDMRCVMPQAAAYCQALDRLGLPPQQVAFVGCDAEELAGAAAAGMSTVSVSNEPWAPATLHVEGILQLADLAPPIGERRQAA